MAVPTIIKCTNIGVDVGDTNIRTALVRVVIDNPGNAEIAMSAQDVKDFQQEIYNNINLFLATCSYYTNDANGYISEFPTGNTFTYGNADTGLRIGFNVLGSNYRTYQYQYASDKTTGLFLDGRLLCGGTMYTGYSTYEYTVLFIITDSDYNVYAHKAGANAMAGINMRASSLGVTRANNGNVVTLVDHSIDSFYAGAQSKATTLQYTGLNLAGYVKTEYDPTIIDPYGGAGESEPGGGDGNFDFSSTVIPIPGLPNIGATDTGFISLYKPTAAQLKSLANYMWAGAFDVTQFKKLFADPMDAILGLHIIPTTAAHPASGSASLVIGNIDTGLTMPTCTEQYYEADMGEITVPAKWGAYLDYSPYTKLALYLPYIGFVPLSPDDCMRGSIKVVYHVDVLSGTCMAFVYCVSNRGQDGHTLYMFNGSCACDCPVTSGQYRSALEGLLGIAGSIGRVAAGDVAGGIKDAISNVTSMVKPEIGRSGSFGGSGGLMGIQYPYLVLTVPRMCVPGQQNTYVGYPSYVTKTIGDLSGYTSIDVSHLNNMTCMQAETDEIISLLEEGVIL